MRKEYKAYKKVGKLQNSIGELLELDFPKVVYASPGVIKHIKKRHGKQLDYFGISNKKNLVKSIELIKSIDNIELLLGLEIDAADKYIYVATLYPITIGKLNSKLFKGNIVKASNSGIKEKLLLCN